MGVGTAFLFLIHDAVGLRDPRGAALAIGVALLLVLGIRRVVLSEATAARNAAQLAQRRQAEAEAEAARETAEQALQAKNRFFTVLGHEIRTPINAVLGMSEVLLATPLSPSQRGSAEVIRQGADSLLAVVNDLLDFSRMEAGEFEIKSLPMNPGRVIERLATLMQETATARDLSLDVRLEHLPRMARGDEARLGQILLNLVSNAIKFSHSGVIRVVARSVEVESGFDLTVSVSDPGIGIPAETLPTVFQPFSQLSMGLNRTYEGTGLGLAISERLAELMGGWIRVESQPGVGSEFTFQVRLQRAVDITTVPIPPMVPGLPRRPSGQRPLTVLVIEDNLVNQLVTCSMVERLGHNVDVAASGAEALRLCGAKAYDVILADLMMPEMDGLETTRRLRETEAGRRAVIIALTAATTAQDREECLASGMDGFLAKPVTVEVLRETFTRFG